MARQPANKGDRGGLVSRSSMERISRAVAAYERGDRNRKPQAMPRAFGDDGGAVIAFGKTTGVWQKGQLQSVSIYGSTSAQEPTEVAENCVNVFANVGNNKWVAITQVAGTWWLIAAEC